MKICRTYADLCLSINDLRGRGKSIGFVPTMGALHKGHMSLIDVAKSRADSVVCSIFVNPKQFAEGEDLEHYPRPEQQDLDLLAGSDVDVVYLPTVNELYPEGENVKILDDDISHILEGEYRPQFFCGVKKVVTKLLHNVTPDVAIFGEKDYQQLRVITQLVDSLGLDVEVVSVPTFRERGGLAFSSRNMYLSEKQRKVAPVLYEVLSEILKNYKVEEDAEFLIQQGKKCIIQAGFDSIDYLEIRDSISLSKKITTSARVLVAAYLGTTRLIDNVG